MILERYKNITLFKVSSTMYLKNYIKYVDIDFFNIFTQSIRRKSRLI